MIYDDKIENVDEAIRKLSEYVSLDYCRETYRHAIDRSRVFTVCKPNKEVKQRILRALYDILRRHVANIEETMLLKNSIYIRSARERNFWYRLGLALSDGSLLHKSRSRIIFTVSTPCTLRAIINAFREVKLYLGRVMISRRSGKVILAFNAVVVDRNVASTMQSLKLCGTPENCQTLQAIVSELRSQKRKLAKFLAGAIDGDGAVSEFDVRLSISIEDPLYKIISNVFTSDNVSYDEKRYILRISTNALRLNGLLKMLANEVICAHKRRRIADLYLKRYSRFRLHNITIDESQIGRVASMLSKDDSVMAIMQKAYTRGHGKYWYFIVPVNKATLNIRKKALNCVLEVLSRELGVDLLPALKMGSRELIIYNQNVVKILRILQREILARGGDGG